MLPEIPRNYILPVERTDWQALLADWRVIIPVEAIPWLLTKFGELLFRQQDGKIGLLQISDFHYSVVAKDSTDFQEWLVDPDKLSEWFLAPLVDFLEASGQTLPAGSCFSFKQALGLGGQLSADNVMVIPITEHFRLWGEVFRQIKDMPQGAEVVIKFT